jgi:hypothetical protein
MSILEKLLDNKDNFDIKIFSSKETNTVYIYEYGNKYDYFVLLIEGSYIVESGREKIESFTKQFEHFGTKALIGDCNSVDECLANTNKHDLYVPEYSLKIDFNNNNYNKNNFISNIYFKLNRKVWLNAVKATQLTKKKYLNINV